jgi:hypothetical protein
VPVETDRAEDVDFRGIPVAGDVELGNGEARAAPPPPAALIGNATAEP